ncbi:MAG: arsenosugar biosynthesis radical SAM (seleno)protein ArsS [Myxococcota bacterium]
MSALTLIGRGHGLAKADGQRARLERLPLREEFEAALGRSGLSPLLRTPLEIFQINVGKLCNQTCKHCHVDAGPDRVESMSRETMEACLAAIDQTGVPTVDITGGAPELNPHFEWLIEALAARKKHIIDRCNLTILETGRHQHLPELFARHRVELVCSLPHVQARSTDAQRGAGVYERSIRALQRLNARGYGRDPQLRLVLVTNPVGAFLPAGQASLEREWKAELKRLHDVDFHALYCLTNMPISRYLEWLEQSGNLERYMNALVQAFNPSAAAAVMCRNTISVGWDGQLYDCDFNQMLELPLGGGQARLGEIDWDQLSQRAIVTGRHCFGCTAGAGSSCGGATTAV